MSKAYKKANAATAIQYIHEHFGVIVFLLVVAGIVIISMMAAQQKLTKTKEAPQGTVSLQFNTELGRVAPIIASWKAAKDSTSRQRKEGLRIVPVRTDGLEVAKRQTYQDFIFILCYSLLLAVLLIRLLPPLNRKWINTALTLIALAASMDAIENFFMIATMNGSGIPSSLIWIPASVKTGIVISLLLWILIRTVRLGYITSLPGRFSDFLNQSMHILVSFRIVVISQLVLFFIIWFADQGRDLLLIINNAHIGVISFLIAITMMALLSWYFPKYYENIQPAGKSKKRDSNISFAQFFSGNWSFDSRMDKAQVDIARLMGAATFLIPATGVLNAMRIFKIPYGLQDLSPFILLIATIAFYYLALRREWIKKLFMPGKTVLFSRIFLFIAIIVILILFPVFTRRSASPQFLAWLSVDLFLLSAGFLVFTTLRTCIDRSDSLFRVNITPIIVLSGLLFVILFLAANLWPHWFYFSESLRLFTLPIVISGIIFYIFFFTYLLLAGRKTGIQFITILFIIGLVISAVNKSSLHQVTLVQSKNEYNRLDSLTHYAYHWLAVRTPEIRSFNRVRGKPYPVFLVNAYGGGIRAAAWTTLVIDSLSMDLQQRAGSFQDPLFSKDFQHYVFSYSGASGGTIGASLLCASRFAAVSQNKPDVLDTEWKSIFKNDYLTPVVTALMGRDVWNAGTGQHLLRDRAYIQEDIWEKQLMKYGIDYGRPMSHYWYGITKYDIPLLFANTYNVDSGLKGIAAPVRLHPFHFPGTVFIQDLVKKDSTAGLKLSTASFLSARFPVISPSGKIDDYHHFMDGGLKENSGGETSRQVMSVLDMVWNKLVADSSLDRNSIQFQMLSLPNGVASTDSIQKAKNLFELTAPLTALMNNWIGNTTTADLINKIDRGRYGHNYFTIQPLNIPVRDFFPVLPLGWQISDEALDQMRFSLRRNPGAIRQVMAVF